MNYEAPGQIEKLFNWSVDSDKKNNELFDLHRNGAHSKHRILHHKDNTGYVIQESLRSQVSEHSNIEVVKHFFAIEILIKHHFGQIVTRFQLIN